MKDIPRFHMRVECRSWFACAACGIPRDGCFPGRGVYEPVSLWLIRIDSFVGRE